MNAFREFKRNSVEYLSNRLFRKAEHGLFLDRSLAELRLVKALWETYRYHIQLGDPVLLDGEGQWYAVLFDQHFWLFLYNFGQRLWL